MSISALLDSGVTGMFVNRKFVQEHKLETSLLPQPIPVWNIDGSTNENGSITEEADIILRFGDHMEQACLTVANLGQQSVIIRHSWLHHHNLEVNWVTQKVLMSQCPPSCGKQVAPPHPDSPLESGDVIGVAFLSPESEEFIQVTTTPSQHLAQEALLQEEGGQKSQFEEIIPKSYHDFRDVFSKEAFTHLPPQKPWDHVIELVPEAQLPRGCMFPLSSIKQ